MRTRSACTRDTHLSEAEQREIDETWEAGLARLNQRLLNKRSDRAAEVLAKRSAGYLDLSLYRARRSERETLGSPPP